MNLLEIIGYPLFFVAALELVLGIILVRHNPRKSPVNASVAAFSFFSSAFSLSTAVMYLRASRGLDFTLASKMTWVAWLSIPAALQFIYFLKDEKSRVARLIGWVLYPFWSLILLLSLTTDLIVARPYTLIPYDYHAGPLDHPARVVAGGLILWLIIEIAVLRKKVRGMKKAQLDYFFFGTLIFAGGGSLMGAFLQLLGGMSFDPTLSSYFSFCWLLLTFYAITRYRLFDIPLILSRTLGIGLLLTLIAGIHLALVKLAEPVLGEISSDLISFSIMGLIILGTPFPNRVQEWINGIVLKGRYDYQRLLKESSQAIITILDLDLLLDYIIGSIQKSLEVDRVRLFLKTEEGRYADRRGAEDRLTADLDDGIVQWLKGERKIIIREELEGSYPPGESDRLHEALVRIDAEIGIPLFFKRELKGVLVLGPKGNGKPYVQSDVDLLLVLAGHAAVAIENARLYDEARRMKESLQESEQKFRTLAETMNAALVIYRRDKFLYVNPAAVAIAGYTYDELLAMDLGNIVHPADLGLVRQRALDRLQGKPVPAQIGFKIIRKNGDERWVMGTAGLIDYEREPAVLSTLLDITDYRRGEEERQRLYEENIRHYREKIEEELRHQSEKEKILMDIHDGIGGITTNISLLAEVAQKAPSAADVNRALTTITNLSREGMAEIRNLMYSLDNKDLSWNALVAELRNQGIATVAPHAIAFDLAPEIDDRAEKPESLLCLNLFRIYREALTNIIKHAKATGVKVALHVGKERLILTIHDNGRGRDAAAADGKGRGEKNMKRRAAEIGGTVSVVATGGTKVTVDVPLVPTLSASANELL